MIRKTSFALGAVCAVFANCIMAAAAATVEVTNVAELTNAVTRANAGEGINTIRLMKTGSPYVVNDEWNLWGQTLQNH